MIKNKHEHGRITIEWYEEEDGLHVFNASENALLEVWLHFNSDSPKVRSLTIPDERSIPILVKYDFSKLRATEYKPRFADDRVGHFLSLQQDFTSDRPSSPYLRRIHRWNLEKKDPAAALS